MPSHIAGFVPENVIRVTWDALVLIYLQTHEGAGRPNLTSGRRMKLDAALCEHEPDQIVLAWRWLHSSPHERAAKLRVDGHANFETLIAHLDQYIDLANDPALWKLSENSQAKRRTIKEQLDAATKAKGSS